MEILASDFSNSDNLNKARKKALKGSAYQFIVVEAPGMRGLLGGSFNWKIYGTNSMRELIPHFERMGVEIFKVLKKEKMVSKEKTAREYIEGLSEKERLCLLNEMLADYLLNK